MPGTDPMRPFDAENAVSAAPPTTTDRVRKTKCIIIQPKAENG
jgi:hypothetical protein